MANYYGRLPIGDTDNLPVSEFNFVFNELKEIKKKEKQAMEKRLRR